MTTRDLLHGYGAGIMQNPYYGAASERSLPYYGKNNTNHQLIRTTTPSSTKDNILIIMQNEQDYFRISKGVFTVCN